MGGDDDLSFNLWSFFAPDSNAGGRRAFVSSYNRSYAVLLNNLPETGPMAVNDRIEPRALSLGHLAVELDL